MFSYNFFDKRLFKTGSESSGNNDFAMLEVSWPSFRRFSLQNLTAKLTILRST